MEPEERIGFAAQNGMPIQVLLELESIAGRMGLELQGGSCKPALLQAQSAMGGGDEGGADMAGLGFGGEGGMGEHDDGEGGAGFGGGEGGAGGGGPVSALDVLSAAKDKALALGAYAAFFLAIPAFLAIIAKRRGLSTGDLARSILRLPFSD